MKTAQSRQKSYADKRRRSLDFKVSSKVFLKISPVKGITQFRKRGKLNPQFIGPFEFQEHVGKVSYWLALSPVIFRVQDISHFSILRKYINDPSHILQYPKVEYSVIIKGEV